MINTKALIKAIQFISLPTLSLILFLFFVILDWDATISFLTGNGVYSIIIRVLFILVEIILVRYTYLYYKKQFEKENTPEELKVFYNKNQITSKQIRMDDIVPLIQGRFNTPDSYSNDLYDHIKRKHFHIDVLKSDKDTIVLQKVYKS